MNCVCLLHGAEKSKIETIARDGFKEIYASPNAWYGMGIYLTPQVCKALQYARADGCRPHPNSHNKCGGHYCMCNPDGNGMITQRLICSVAVLGKCYPAKGHMEGYKAPPVGYDSIVANHEINNGSCDHREFVVFDGARVVPKFVVEVEYKYVPPRIQ
jgi:hypothetical protein